jgi:hypothetical protein
MIDRGDEMMVRLVLCCVREGRQTGRQTDRWHRLRSRSRSKDRDITNKKRKEEQ